MPAFPSSIWPFDDSTPHYERLSLEFKILISRGFVPDGATGDVARLLDEAGPDGRVLDVGETLRLPLSSAAGADGPVMSVLVDEQVAGSPACGRPGWAVCSRQPRSSASISCPSGWNAHRQTCHLRSGTSYKGSHSQSFLDVCRASWPCAVSPLKVPLTTHALGRTSHDNHFDVVSPLSRQQLHAHLMAPPSSCSLSDCADPRVVPCPLSARLPLVHCRVSSVSSHLNRLPRFILKGCQRMSHSLACHLALDRCLKPGGALVIAEPEVSRPSPPASMPAYQFVDSPSLHSLYSLC